MAIKFSGDVYPSGYFVSRVVIDFSDLPHLQALAVVNSVASRMANEQKLYDAAIQILDPQKTYSVLAYQNNKVWLTITSDSGFLPTKDKTNDDK